LFWLIRIGHFLTDQTASLGPSFPMTNMIAFSVSVPYLTSPIASTPVRDRPSQGSLGRGPFNFPPVFRVHLSQMTRPGRGTATPNSPPGILTFLPPILFCEDHTILFLVRPTRSRMYPTANRPLTVFIQLFLHPESSHPKGGRRCAPSPSTLDPASPPFSFSDTFIGDLLPGSIYNNTGHLFHELVKPRFSIPPPSDLILF